MLRDTQTHADQALDSSLALTWGCVVLILCRMPFWRSAWPGARGVDRAEVDLLWFVWTQITTSKLYLPLSIGITLYQFISGHTRRFISTPIKLCHVTYVDLYRSILTYTKLLLHLSSAISLYQFIAGYIRRCISRLPICIKLHYADLYHFYHCIPSCICICRQASIYIILYQVAHVDLFQFISSYNNLFKFISSYQNYSCILPFISMYTNLYVFISIYTKYSHAPICINLSQPIQVYTPSIYIRRFIST